MARADLETPGRVDDPNGANDIGEIGQRFAHPRSVSRGTEARSGWRDNRLSRRGQVSGWIVCRLSAPFRLLHAQSSSKLQRTHTTGTKDHQGDDMILLSFVSVVDFV